MGKKVAKQITPAPVIGVGKKCFQFKETAAGAPDTLVFNEYDNCNECQNAESSEATTVCSREYSLCGDPDPELKVFLPCTPHTDTFIRHTGSGDCYQFDGINHVQGPTTTWPLYTRAFTSCTNCFGNKIYQELNNCKANIIISRADYEAFGSKPFINFQNKCYQIVGDTLDAATQVPENSWAAKCDCVNGIAKYNLKWLPCAGKQGEGPDFIVKGWNFDPGGFIKIQGGC